MTHLLLKSPLESSVMHHSDSTTSTKILTTFLQEEKFLQHNFAVKNKVLFLVASIYRSYL